MDKKIRINTQIPQITSKTEFNIEKNMNKDNLDITNNEYNNPPELSNIFNKKLSDDKFNKTLTEPVEEMKFEKPNDLNNLKARGTLTSLLRHEQTINPYKIKIPKITIREQIIPLEKELFSLLNINYGEEIIYEDFALVSNNDDYYYYVHLLRKAKLNTKQRKFCTYSWLFIKFYSFSISITFFITEI